MHDTAVSKRECDAMRAQLEKELHSTESIVESDLSIERRRKLQEKQRVRRQVEAQIKGLITELLSKKVLLVTVNSSAELVSPVSLHKSLVWTRVNTVRHPSGQILTQSPLNDLQGLELTDRTVRAVDNNEKLRIALQAKAKQAERMMLLNQGLAFENTDLRNDVELSKTSEVTRCCCR